MGVEYIHNSYWGSNMTVFNPGHWAYDYTGVGTLETQVLPGLLGYEIDGYWEGTPCGYLNTSPPNWGTGGQYDTIKLADSTVSNLACSTLHSYMTIYTAINGPSTNGPPHAQVFATGSMEWNYGLDDFGYYSKGYDSPSRTNQVARQITHNIIRKFTGKSTGALP